jgi:hypothetical protein
MMTKNRTTLILIAILAGCSVIAFPYAIFFFLIETFGEDIFLVDPMLISILMFVGLLVFGGYTSGKIFSRGNFEKLKPLYLFLVTPGIYVGIAGFIFNLIIDGSIPPDGLVALSSMAIFAIAISTPFTYWGFKKNRIEKKS